jgi:DNA recombination protein RmuC
MIDSTTLFIALAGQALVLGAVLFLTRRNGSDQATGRTDEVVAARLDGLDRTMQAHFQGMNAQGEQQRQSLDATVAQMHEIRKETGERVTLLTTQVREQLDTMRRENEQRLEQMRQTVDEKLTGTLNTRITESFASVSERLEKVHAGLGEMQILATGVGDLKKVMTNVRVRGTWGEYQLSALLEQFLTEQQFERNYRPREDSREVVEFAIRFPGRNGDGSPVYLPVDSKFPIEDFARLIEASDTGDQEAVVVARSALVRAVKTCAKEIRNKYIHPPTTTDFGVLFLPTESLYAEIVREGGLVEELLRVYQVHLAGPTTLAALLTSFRVGFQSIAIEQRAGEIRDLLGVVRMEFRKFNEVIDKVEKNMLTATKALEDGRRRTRVMERSLKEIEMPGAARAAELLGAEAVEEADESE